MAEFISAIEAAKLIPDGATVAVAGMGLSGWAEEIGCAIRDNFKETGHPCNLNLKQGSAMGDWKTRGLTRLGEAGPGLVTRWCGAQVGSVFSLRDMAQRNELPLHELPQGIIVNLWREIAAGRPGLLSKVGLGTYVDPRINGGKMNECAKEDLVELVNFNGKEYLFYKSFPLDVAILRGTIADENGNISFAHESVVNEGMAVATAAHNSGGIVIVQVEYLAQKGSLNPKDVKIPGVLVDYVVQATSKDACWQTEGTYYEPSFCGDMRKPLAALKPDPLDERKVIARRCAMEIHRGDLINLGVGIPAQVANVVAEEGLIDDVTFSTESGMVGGVPAPLPNFGSAFNPEATVEHGAMFDIIDGGGLDMTCLGIGEADMEGNINVSKFAPQGDEPARISGPGGFIDISCATDNVVFCGTFVGKAKIKVGDGKLEIIKEGSIKKFLKQVYQITFSGKYARPEQNVLYVTERCVFKLINGKMTVIEIAPGIDIEKDVIDQMGFVPEVSPDLKLMDAGLFREKWGGLADVIK